MKLLFATNNQNKILEVKNKIASSIELLSLKDCNLESNPEENGATFKENAFIKVNEIWQLTKINCFAEDSGLVIEDLNEEPGIKSASYCGERNDKKNIQKVLDNLISSTNRNAYFITVICLILKGESYFFEGKILGKINHEPKGENGFGYDSIFIPHGFNKTFAEISLEEKNRMSHRSIALEKLITFINNYGN